MDTNSTIRRAATAPALALLLALALALAACGRGAGDSDDEGAQAGPVQAGAAGGAAPGDVAGLDEDIGRLERLTERNPADDETRDELARAYVRRGDAHRAAGQLRDALADYQRALRLDPDNNEAQNNAFATKGQLGGEEEGENGEPAPPPITPNITGEDERTTPTPKKQ